MTKYRVPVVLNISTKLTREQRRDLHYLVVQALNSNINIWEIADPNFEGEAYFTTVVPDA